MKLKVFTCTICNAWVLAEALECPHCHKRHKQPTAAQIATISKDKFDKQGKVRA